MSLLDGLKENLTNPLVENEKDFNFAMECDFDSALEAAVEKHLSQADIDAILRGDDDIPEDEDDPDEDNDDVSDTLDGAVVTESLRAAIVNAAYTPATEGIKGLILQHRAHKVDKAKVTVLADEISQPGKAEWAIKKFVAAADNMMTKDPTALTWIKSSYYEYQKDDNATQKAFMKTFSGYPIMYVTVEDKLQLIEIPTMTKKSTPSTMVLLPAQMAQIILKPIESSEIADTAAKESAGSDDDIDHLLATLEALSDPTVSDTATESELITQCDAAFEACKKQADEGCDTEEGCNSKDCDPKDIALDDSTAEDTADPPDEDDDDPFGEDAFESMLSKCTNNL